ncbi:cystinosin-like isoform X2 [Labeo rohita]|uniref:Cystinosin-like isoform X2 n=1 Tax=Labeo rohita TaxID=84645 RepID=A0A498L1H4_LABRO|nr:cystinosin-like isoform X2 [Labeo rohita]
MKQTAILFLITLSACAHTAFGDAEVNIKAPATVSLQEQSSDNITITLSSPLNTSVTVYFNITYKSRNVSLIILLPDEVVVPAGNVSVSFEVQAKGVGQVTAYLSSNNTHIKSCLRSGVTVERRGLWLDTGSKMAEVTDEEELDFILRSSDSSMADENEKPAVAPPVFVFQKDKAQKRSAEGSSAEDGEVKHISPFIVI